MEEGIERPDCALHQGILDNVVTGSQSPNSKGRLNIKNIPKVGSLQMYIHADDIAENLAPEKFKPDEVHKIAILDYRVVNTDRNECNILVKLSANRKQGKYYKLIPIDHGSSLSDSLDMVEFDYCWLMWPQAHIPFSNKILQYIASVDIMDDIKFLDQQFKFRPVI